MGKPLQKTGLIKQVNDDVVSNPSDNTAFSQVLDSRLSRRSLLQSSGALGVAAALPAGLSLFADKVEAGVFSRDNIGKARGLGFTPVAMSAADTVVVPPGYSARAFYKWGDAVGIAGKMPAFKPDASNLCLIHI